MKKNELLIELVSKIFELTTNADKFTTSGVLPKTNITIKISFKRADEKESNAIRFETKDINLEYHFGFKDKEKYETFLFTALQHILDLYSDKSLSKERLPNEKIDA